MEWLSMHQVHAQKQMHLRLYAKPSEVICLTFQPLKMEGIPDWNPQWEEWHCYPAPLVVYLSDYETLLKKYFDKMYPTKDAFDGTAQTHFDLCFDNWLGTNDWNLVILAIENDLAQYESDEKHFYQSFLHWLKEALQHTKIIVVEGNL